MSSPEIYLAALPIQAPVTVLTNLLLALQALWLSVRLSDREPASPRGWRLFLWLMVAGALAGGVKHATDPGWLHETARLTTNVALGAALTAVAVSGGTGGRSARRRIQLLYVAGFTLFLLSTIAWSTFKVVVAYGAVVGPGVAAAELRSALGGRPGAALALAALTLAVVAGLVYASPLRWGRWIAAVDIAHVVLMGSLAMLAAAYRASRRCR